MIGCVGNVFVIAAILLERHLHSVANYLIVSLAVADLLVACLVMPLAAVNEVIYRSLCVGQCFCPNLSTFWSLFVEISGLGLGFLMLKFCFFKVKICQSLGFLRSKAVKISGLGQNL